MSDAKIEINRIGTGSIWIPIVGTAPLIVHKFSEKSKRQMLDAMQGRKSPKQSKDPEAEYLAAMYLHDDDTPGFPVIAFKAAAVGACRFFGKSLPMTTARQCMFFNAPLSKREGQKLVRIEGEHKMREDVVRVGNGGTDLRYRPEFPEWRTEIEVIYVKSLLTSDSVLSLVDAGGMGVGIGEWRPEKKGDMGTFAIDGDREVRITE